MNLTEVRVLWQTLPSFPDHWSNIDQFCLLNNVGLVFEADLLRNINGWHKPGCVSVARHL